jgi:hypothetical protein
VLGVTAPAQSVGVGTEPGTGGMEPVTGTAVALPTGCGAAVGRGAVWWAKHNGASDLPLCASRLGVRG